MNTVIVFLVGLAITMGVVFFAILYLRDPLQKVLTDLCGSTDRARFWTTFSNVTLFLVPFVIALDHQPDASSKQAAIFAISDQVEYATIGFVVSVVVMGFILSKYISQLPRNVVAKGNQVPQRSA
jgi:hypothetical protein